MKINQDFYDAWSEQFRAINPHRTPPTKEQMEGILDILTPEQQQFIVHQFDIQEEE